MLTRRVLSLNSGINSLRGNPQNRPEGLGTFGTISSYFQIKLSGADMGTVTVIVSGSGFPQAPPRHLQFASIVLLVQATETKLTVHAPGNLVGRKA
jgi:hypothetical protein